MIHSLERRKLFYHVFQSFPLMQLLPYLSGNHIMEWRNRLISYEILYEGRTYQLWEGTPKITRNNIYFWMLNGDPRCQSWSSYIAYTNKLYNESTDHLILETCIRSVNYCTSVFLRLVVISNFMPTKPYCSFLDM